MHDIKINNLTVFDIYGASRVPISGSFNADTLASFFIEIWIPYFECEKCGKSSYCKYVQPDPHRRDRLKDIKCGVAAEAIRNFVKHTFGILTDLDETQLQHYLDGAFHFFKYVYSSEILNGSFVSSDHLEYFGDFAPLLYSQTKDVRENLNQLISHLQHIPNFRIKKDVILVEGESEKHFIDKLKETHLASLLDLIVETYKGKGNRRAQRIQMLLEKYKKDGYTIMLQGDSDGKTDKDIEKLISKQIIEKTKIFLFKFDFESSIPSKLIFFILQHLGFLKDITLEDFSSSRPNHLPLGVFLKEKFGIDLEVNGLKIKIADSLATILTQATWWSNEGFIKTELGRFLDFIQRRK
uniref:Uncharacterized protein n=1 Tax=candidate division WWE3 bacterium TaxID=2053526 RepID=A0A7C4XGR1_UNCKA